MLFMVSMSGETFDTAMKDMGVLFLLEEGNFICRRILFISFYRLFIRNNETPSELIETYKGEKFVEVKTGRFWEAGGTPTKVWKQVI